MPPRRARKPKDEEVDYAPMVKDEDDVKTQIKREGMGPSMDIDVRTKFPVARIKRIMQADEDVGKVAQVTPIAVCMSFFLVSFHLLSLHFISLVFTTTLTRRSPLTYLLPPQQQKP